MGVTTSRRLVVRIADGAASSRSDAVAVEAPLAIVVDGEPMATTMRTPGHDLELVAGWLVNESGVRAAQDIATLASVHARDELEVDTVHAALRPGVDPPMPRAFVTTGACGVCSADSLSPLAAAVGASHSPEWRLARPAVHDLVAGMRAGQRMFEQTGSLHAAAIADPAGTVLWVREDVGRHNAVDKAIGAALLDGRLPLTDCTLVVSGRVAYEIVHKAVTAGVAAIVAVSGPTSLAIDLAERHGLVLVGFAREGRLTVYAGADRVGDAP
ncbi:MAG: formate dehydrogenase accessory sulfurtransferase FdhD [Candidatus Nanopelagicales bacterium]